MIFRLSPCRFDLRMAQRKAGIGEVSQVRREIKLIHAPYVVQLDYVLILASIDS
jgi:hypothetical protein